MAIVSLLLNIFVLLGIGSMIGGKMKTGVIQLVLTLVSLPLMLVLIGFPLAFGSWIWGIVTGIQMINESK